jgi:uncharacterized metal-binding protein
MDKRTKLKINLFWIAALYPQLIVHRTFADTSSADVTQISSFIKSIITILAGLAGMIATGYFVVGGFSYITSSGNPQRLEKAKRTILYSAIGLSITIAAFVLSDIISSLATKAFGV